MGARSSMPHCLPAPSAVALTEILRAGSFDGAAEQYALVEKEYHKTIEAINALD